MYTYDIEQLLKNGSAVKLKPQGYSMYPLFLPGRDEAVIEHCVPSELHRGDVILYRRVQGILVLHRICRITRDGFYLVGDNHPIRYIHGYYGFLHHFLLPATLLLIRIPQLLPEQLKKQLVK